MTGLSRVQYSTGVPTQVNIHEAKTHLSRLVDRAAEGEEIVIARAGKPIATLVRYRAPTQRRVPGLLRGKIHILPGFDEADATIADEFEGAP